MKILPGKGEAGAGKITFFLKSMDDLGKKHISFRHRVIFAPAESTGMKPFLRLLYGTDSLLFRAGCSMFNSRIKAYVVRNQPCSKHCNRCRLNISCGF